MVYQQVAKCLEIGLFCQEIDPSKRPYIWHIIHVIREIEGANGKISNAYEHTFGQVSSYAPWALLVNFGLLTPVVSFFLCTPALLLQIGPYSEDDMLGIEPFQLHFPFERNKQMSCTLKLTNETDSYIAFNVQNMSPKSYNTQPQKDIMPPRSKCNIEITLQAQGNVPIDMQRANEFVVWSTKVNDGLAIEDMATIKFIKEAINVVDDVNLDVAFDISEPQEASDKISEVSCLRILTCNIYSIILVSRANDLLL